MLRSVRQMSDSFEIALIVLSGFFVAILVVPMFVAPGRRERGIIYGLVLAVVFLGWLKIRHAFLLGQIPWTPVDIAYLRIFLLAVMAANAAFFLYQFMPKDAPLAKPPDRQRGCP
ncbi:MAG TPA: hypothetical protein VI685_19680 [Candidatus Angelobacter sp.]